MQHRQNDPPGASRRAEDEAHFRLGTEGADIAQPTDEKQDSADKKSRSRDVEYGRAWAKRQKASKSLLVLAFRSQRP
jgi:hypothetical protein